ncbi:TonB-dependent receptor [Flavihumibacter rivuli]|uniref:TonB-dependent receptor n=1 Tax=Flavihumibacter rivuli TaxID=2838156 RepID=UPI001BDE2B4D|nr:TonB-dependent receptor [Flavihumibacter rivuli]ULQ57871.1 TonB-dependent receptor [Flavihumibacter rivuli]
MINRLLKKWMLTLVGNILTLALVAQTGSISGTVIDKNTLQPLAGVSLILQPGNTGQTSSDKGTFRFDGITPGTYSIALTAIGYQSRTLPNLVITTGNEQTLTIELEASASTLTGVVVSGRKNTARATSLESPLSIQRLTTEDIKANPGGNFDISKVIQSLPGVGGGVGGGGFRNDIIIRGGAPSENVFYLDGIEVPIINHFSTQGSGGGPQGILNVSFIEDVKLSSSAFDARYDNALSSVFQFKQKNGNSKRLQGNIRLSGTELAATFDGPISPKTTFLASARRSYLDFLFKTLDLPIRPNYWDFQFKTTTKLNDKMTLNFLGVGAIDEFRFAAPKEATPEKLYAINSSPIINQWTYTIGASLRRLTENGYWNLSLSRNTLDNQSDKYEDNEDPKPSERTLLIKSRETENKFRFDVTNNINGWKLSYGASLQYIQFDNEFFQRFRPQLTDENGNIIQEAETLTSLTDESFLRYGAFVQAGKRVLNDRLALSAGIRVDANNLENGESNPFQQFSPRISASYALTEKWNISASYGLYYRLPSYTQLFYQNLLNSSIILNPGDYIRSSHWVAGLEFLPSSTTRFTLEGFYKKYSNYPVSVLDGISLANKGTEFGAIGNEPVTQDGKGRAYGFEFFAQQKLTRRFFGILSYTFYRSEFTDISDRYIRSSWDNRHLLSTTLGYKFNRNWELGLKFRYQGAAPYTPFDMPASQLNYLTLGTGVLDYTNTNTLELPAFHASDIRIDKKWNLRRFTLDLYLDIQNWYNSQNPGLPQYTFRRNADNTAFVTTDGQPIQQNGSNAIPVILPNDESRVLPTIGFIIEF